MQFPSPVPIEKRITIVINHLLKGDLFSSLSLQFSVSTFTCHSICNESELCTICRDYIKFLQDQDLTQGHITNIEETVGYLN